jgi:hypothetical protein
MVELCCDSVIIINGKIWHFGTIFFKVDEVVQQIVVIFICKLPLVKSEEHKPRNKTGGELNILNRVGLE